MKKITGLLLALMIGLTACGHNVSPTPGSSVPAQEAQENKVTGEASLPDQEESKAFKMGVMFSPQDTLDPATVTSPGGMVLLFTLYDSLATIDTNGTTMRMAQSIEPNEDFTAYTVKLKDKLEFTDGNMVTGEDVLLSLRHLAESQMYQSLYGNLDVEKSKAEGQRVTLVLKTPSSDFVASNLAMFSPVARKGEFNGVGAGAYSVEKGDPQTGFVLKANPDYYAGKPAIPEVTLLNVPDSSSKVKALQTGEIDYAWGLDSSAIQVLKQEQDIELPGGSLDSAMAFELVLNTRVAPFDDPELRKAAKLAVDREKLVKTLLGDYGEAGNDMLGKGFPGYPDDLAQTKVNQEEAKRIFAEKGVNSFVIVTSDIAPGLNKATEMMVQDFRAVGVSVEVEQLDPQTFFSQMGELYQKPAFTFYWLNRSPLTEFSSQILKDSPYNVSGYSSDSIEKNYLKAMTTQDPAIQSEAIQAISKEICELGGDLIWGYQMDISARRKGFEAPLTQSVPWLGEATFTPGKS